MSGSRRGFIYLNTFCYKLMVVSPTHREAFLRKLGFSDRKIRSIIRLEITAVKVPNFAHIHFDVQALSRGAHLNCLL